MKEQNSKTQFKREIHKHCYQEYSFRKVNIHQGEDNNLSVKA